MMVVLDNLVVFGSQEVVVAPELLDKTVTQLMEVLEMVVTDYKTI